MLVLVLLLLVPLLTLPSQIPNRHSYILWLKGLVDSTSYHPSHDDRIVVLDIGTGAGCIYPLLGCVQRPWSFFATDIDPTNHTFASRNIISNGLENRITLLPLRTPSDPLIPPEVTTAAGLDIVMTNPPFYASATEMRDRAAAKDRPPLSACTGAPVEMVTQGGEVAFVSCLIEESLVLRDRVRWYTAMLGKHSSLGTLIEKLKNASVLNYAVTELTQGRTTRRWALGWSFGSMRPSQIVARDVKGDNNGNNRSNSNSLGRLGRLLPLITEADVLIVPAWDAEGRPGVGADVLGRRANEAISALELVSWEWDADQLCGFGKATGIVWSRAWRRRKTARQDYHGAEDEDDNGDDDEERKGKSGLSSVDVDDVVVAFGFRIEVRAGTQDSRVWCRWLEGVDPVVYESFRGWLGRKVQEGG